MKSVSFDSSSVVKHGLIVLSWHSPFCVNAKKVSNINVASIKILYVDKSPNFAGLQFAFRVPVVFCFVWSLSSFKNLMVFVLQCVPLSWSHSSHVPHVVPDGSTGHDSPATGGQEHAAPQDYLMSLALATNQRFYQNIYIFIIYSFKLLLCLR